MMMMISDRKELFRRLHVSRIFLRLSQQQQKQRPRSAALPSSIPIDLSLPRLIHFVTPCPFIYFPIRKSSTLCHFATHKQLRQLARDRLILWRIMSSRFACSTAVVCRGTTTTLPPTVLLGSRVEASWLRLWRHLCACRRHASTGRRQRAPVTERLPDSAHGALVWHCRRLRRLTSPAWGDSTDVICDVIT